MNNESRRSLSADYVPGTILSAFHVIEPEISSPLRALEWLRIKNIL